MHYTRTLPRRNRDKQRHNISRIQYFKSTQQIAAEQESRGGSVAGTLCPRTLTAPPLIAQSAPSLLQLASQGQRFGNLLADYFFLFIFAIFFRAALAFLGFGEMLQNTNEYLLWLIISCLYYIPQEAHSGRTLGKLITGTKAVSEDGSELTFGQAVGRTLCRFIPFEAFSFLGGDGKPRGWHDTIPKTKVISVRRKRPSTEREQASEDQTAVSAEQNQAAPVTRPNAGGLRGQCSESVWQSVTVWLCVAAGVICFGFVWFDSEQPPKQQQSQKQAGVPKQESQKINWDDYEAVDKPRPPKKKESAIDRLRKAAEQGDATAQFNLGYCYCKGQGVPQDYAEAVKWYRKAAEQGEAGAQCNLGNCYQKGEGVPQDYAEAIRWYRKAAEQGDAGAQYNLGLCYDASLGVPMNIFEAVKWYRKAAEQGHAGAQCNLGYCFEKGWGVPRNAIEAYKWLSLAAAEATEDAAKWRDIFAAQMTRAEIVEAQRRAAAFAAKQERTEAKPDSILRTPEPWAERPKPSENTMSVGTGFFVTDDGYLVTCEHVVRGATSFRVKVPGRSVTAKLIKKDRSLDVALLKVNATCRGLPVSSDPRLKLGDGVFTIGFPNPELQGVQPKLTRGEISSMAGIRDNPRYFQISVPVQPGNSGGALVDESGNVVGVVTARLDDLATYEASGSFPQNVNYAVKGNLVRTFLNSVPELSGKLKAPRTAKDREAASAAAERAAVLVIAE